MARFHQTLFALFCLMGILGCGGGGGSSPAPQGPSGLAATWDGANSLFAISWTAPKDAFEGYNLEGKVDGSAFTQLNQTLIPAATTGGYVALAQPASELAHYQFRLWAVRNGANSASSNIAEVVIPPTAPELVSTTFSQTEGAVDVRWNNRSLKADRCVLERTKAEDSGAVVWTVLPLSAPLQNAYLDAQVLEGERYQYRVTAWQGTLASANVSFVQPILIPPLVPTSFAAASLPSQVALTWVNRSRTATRIQVSRTPADSGSGGIVATLSGSATSWVDTGLAAGYYTYSLLVSDSHSTSTGPTLVAAPGNPPGSPVLTAAAVTLPTALTASLSAASISPGGSWALGGSFPQLVVPAVSWAAWPLWSPGSWRVPTDFLRVDQSSNPHTIHMRQESSATATLVHGHFDGAAWAAEDVVSSPTPVAANAFATFRLDQAGQVRVLQEIGDSIRNIGNLFYIRKQDGQWLREPLAPGIAWDGWEGDPRLFLDASDTPHVLIPTWFNTREFSRNADGTWTSAILPNAVPAGGAYSFEDAAWADEATAWVFYIKYIPDGARKMGFWGMRKVGSVWQPPVLLKAYASTGQDTASVALSPDKKRVAAVCYTANGLVLFTEGPLGWVESLLPAPDLAFPFFQVAFDGGNRLHVLVKASAYAAEVLDFHEE